jgi:hypothetical protein
MFSTLFKPFVAADYPIRYFLFLFIWFFGGWNLADDITILFGRSKPMGMEIVFLLAFLVALLMTVARYMDQKKVKEALKSSGAS